MLKKNYYYYGKKMDLIIVEYATFRSEDSSNNQLHQEDTLLNTANETIVRAW